MKPRESDLVAAYEYLAQLKPFSGWKIPSSDRVDFVVTRSKAEMGSYDGDPHTIRVSSHYCKTQQDVLETVAHEMVHVHLERSDNSTHYKHCKAFKKAAKAICRQFGWSEKKF